MDAKFWPVVYFDSPITNMTMKIGANDIFKVKSQKGGAKECLKVGCNRSPKKNNQIQTQKTIETRKQTRNLQIESATLAPLKKATTNQSQSCQQIQTNLTNPLFGNKPKTWNHTQHSEPSGLHSLRQHGPQQTKPKLGTKLKTQTTPKLASKPKARKPMSNGRRSLC